MQQRLFFNQAQVDSIVQSWAAAESRLCANGIGIYEDDKRGLLIVKIYHLILSSYRFLFQTTLLSGLLYLSPLFQLWWLDKPLSSCLCHCWWMAFPPIYVAVSNSLPPASPHESSPLAPGWRAMLTQHEQTNPQKVWSLCVYSSASNSLR